MYVTVGGLIEWSANNYPDKLALVYADKQQRWTYRVLNQKVNQFAGALQKLGVQKGDVVSTFLYNTSEFVLALFASAKIGAIFNPINYRLSSHELHFILSDARSKVLLYEKALKDTVQKVIERGVETEHFIYVDDNQPDHSLSFYQLLEEQNGQFLKEDVTENDRYIMMYTSGTTGRPKGVIHRHRSMVHHNFLMMQCMGLTKDDIGLSAAPLNHTAELHTSFLPRVQVGATNILMHSFDPKKVLETIEKEKVTHLFAAPTMVNMLLHVDNFDSYNLTSLRLLGYGGASMAPVLIREFQSRVGADLVQMYGTTEMGPVMTVLYPDEQLPKAGSAGKAVMTHEVRIVRLQEDGSPSHPDDLCEVGEIGEIIVKGPCVMEGYYQRPEATDKALAFGWYHTGDMGSYDEDGYIWIRDRMNHMIVSGAENIYPREVEDYLLEHPDVLEAAVIGQPDPTWGQIVVGCIVLKEGSTLTEEELDQFLVNGDKLAKYKRPRKYVFLDRLPKTPSGKIQKYVLEKNLQNA
ncbi:long-chain-fatty-acid--CoA ligase [Bacillus alveayuensis]|jgi:fatty-acyl-CoA synthase|uniref:long-chain-fatty-acid--CoA ligase n=1 Tax=Aeribacillus alveayuensis TaxID=279215 RepID=UPI0005CCF6F9|nr:long-chain-fatty-acid--CoA ligase [Bacillus alveayuensis]